MQKTTNKFKLNDNIITWLAPIYHMNKILGSSRVIVKNKFITTSSSWDKFYSILWMIAVTVSLIHYTKVYYSYYYDKSVVVYIGFSLVMVLQYVSYILNLIYIRFFNKEANIQLYLLLQKINIDLQLDKSKFLTKFAVSRSIIFVILVTIPYEIFFAVHVINIIEEPIYTIFFCFGLLIIYVDIVLTGFFVVCLAIHIGYLNNQIIRYNLQFMPEYRDAGIKRWRSIEICLDTMTRENADKDPAEFSNYVGSVRDILKCYKMVTDLYSFTVSQIT